MKLWDLIDAELLYSNEGIPSTELQSGSTYVRVPRERLWLRTSQILEDFWGSWEWPFRYTVGASATLTTATSSCSAPSDFHIGGYEAAVWIPAQNWEISFLPLHRLLNERRIHGSNTGIPRFYSVANSDSSGIPVLEFDTVSDATYTLAIDYERMAPLLLDKPPIVTTADSAVAGNPNGAYLYKLTLVNADGETDGGPASTSLTVSSKKVSVSGIYVPPGFANCTAKKLYRTVASGSTYKLLATLAVSDTTYTDDTADGSLGATLSTSYSGLERVPSEYHQSCILDGLRVLDAADHGDARSAAEFEGRWRKNLARAKANSIEGREALTRVGDAGPGVWRMH